MAFISITHNYVTKVHKICKKPLFLTLFCLSFKKNKHRNSDTDCTRSIVMRQILGVLELGVANYR